MGIKNMAIKYAFIFVNIFITIFSLFVCYNTVVNDGFSFSMGNYLLLFAFAFLIFLSYLFYKVVKTIYIFVKYLILQQQLSALQQQFMEQQKRNQEFMEMFKNFNSENKN